MFLSYIYSINGVNLDATKIVLDSILNQTDKDFELILISDVEENSDELNDYVRDVFWQHDNCKIIENAALQGVAVSWNAGIELAEGKYAVFLNASDHVMPNHVAEIKKAYEKNGEIDVFEYKVHLFGLADSDTKTYVDVNKVYDLKTDQTPFAYINDLIQAKAFKLDNIKSYQFRFRRFLRYDLLFTYKVLGQATKYMFIESDALIEAKIEETNFSIFDLVNQWPHIFNYYRRINRFRELNDYLIYAYYKIIVHIWLWWIKKYNNKVLMKKAIAFTQRKFDDKREGFMKTNPIYNAKRDQTFTQIVENFSKWMKETLKAV
jgi:glycosyltransferase involved in cell wall biosynthesis